MIGGLLCLSGAAPETPNAAPPMPPADPPGYHLAWHDEFDGDHVDRTKWDFDTGTGFYVDGANGQPGFFVNGWGNDELECYTDRQANAYVADGSLHIKAVKEKYKGGQYTSARVKSGDAAGKALFATTYGRVEFRAKLPVGQGYWPALWMLPQDEAYGGWAASGEIDILEVRGSEPTLAQGTIHYGGSSPKNVYNGKQYKLPDNGTVADWHVYALDWEPGKLSWSVDGHVYFTRDYWFSQDAKREVRPWPAPFDKPFYVVMNLAVGGRFGGNPTPDVPFPDEMVVDYCRVYQKDGGPGPVQPQGPGKPTDPGAVAKPE